MKFITLHHSNMQEDVMVVADTICAFYFSKAHSATHVMVNGGGMFPVKDTVEQIRQKLVNAVTYGSMAKVVDIKTKQELTANPVQAVQKEDKPNE